MFNGHEMQTKTKQKKIKYKNNTQTTIHPHREILRE